LTVCASIIDNWHIGRPLSACHWLNACCTNARSRWLVGGLSMIFCASPPPRHRSA
jgi:hypothetical protein